MGILGQVRKMLLGLSLEETSFERRHFPEWQPALREHLERRAKSYLVGTNLSLEETDPDKLALVLNMIEPELRGFAFEGAGMGLTMLDAMTPWGKGRRLRRFMETTGKPHTYMLYVGAGVAYGAMHFNPASLIRFDTGMSRWLVYDGLGFQHAFFAKRPGTEVVPIPKGLTPFEARVFDGGVGRALWFIFCTDPVRISAWIDRCEASRRPHIWSGVGLAASYAGGVDAAAIDRLLKTAGEHRASARVGMALATDTRFLAGNPTEHLEVIAQTGWGRSARELYQELERIRTRLQFDAQGLLEGRPGIEVYMNGVLEAARAVDSKPVEQRQLAMVTQSVA